MGIGKIGGGENPFLKKMQEMGQAGEVNNNHGQANGIDAGSKIDKAEKTDEIKKPGMEEGAASNNGESNPNAKIDKTQFTDENNIQEIDLEEFEDDFS